MITHQVVDKTGPVTIARMVNATQELIVISAEGIVLRTRLDSIAQIGRSSQGVQVIRLGPGDTVGSLATIDMGAPAKPTAAKGTEQDVTEPAAAKRGAKPTAAKDGASPGEKPPAP